MSINITWPTDKGTKDAVVPLPASGKTSLASLRETIKKHLGSDLPTQGFTLTDTWRSLGTERPFLYRINGMEPWQLQLGNELPFNLTLKRLQWLVTMNTLQHR